MLTHADVFAGIGGFTRGLSGVCRPVVYCEIDSEAQAVLTSCMQRGLLPKAPLLDDVHNLKKYFVTHKSPDIVTAGFPCTGVSVCGKRLGLGDAGTALIFRLLNTLKSLDYPILILENTPRMTLIGEPIMTRMRSLGYKDRWCLMPAYAVGSPQNRMRWYAVFWKRPCELQRLMHALSSSTLGPFNRVCPSRTVLNRDQKDYIRRYKLLGRCVVPHVLLLAIRLMCSSTVNGQIVPQRTAKPDLKLRFQHAAVTIQGCLWPTPRSGNWRTSNILNERITADLASAIKFEVKTPPGSLNINWVEWLQGFPKGWTI